MQKYCFTKIDPQCPVEAILNLSRTANQRRAAVLTLPACESQSVEGNQLRKRPAQMSKIYQLREANFHQLWLRLMYFSLMFDELGPPCLVLRGRLTYLPSLA